MEWAVYDTVATVAAAGGIWAVAGVGIVVLPWTDGEVREVGGALGGLVLRGLWAIAGVAMPARAPARV
jgi:hypothetical protein